VSVRASWVVRAAAGLPLSAGGTGQYWSAGHLLSTAVVCSGGGGLQVSLALRWPV